MVGSIGQQKMYIIISLYNTRCVYGTTIVGRHQHLRPKNIIIYNLLELELYGSCTPAGQEYLMGSAETPS